MVKKEGVSCNICGKSFDSKLQMDQHKNDVHEKMQKTKVTKTAKSSKNYSLSKKYIIVISIGVLIAITVGIITNYVITSKSVIRTRIKNVFFPVNNKWYRMQYRRTTSIP